MIGQSIAHYTITSRIGEGGMGEVYRATDTKLKRAVALKILPESFTDDPQRMARFTREAQVLASLNHPHIGGIYGLEEEDGVRALALELIEGQTLGERIKSGPLPIEDALKIALQIAEALEAAHEKGIIHRDLKPDNVKITPEGQVKVLDFGLAKALESESGSLPGLTQSPTITAQPTAAGVILGTAAYMSPEQAKGKPADRRADIWAFGAVLFEMLTGRRSFLEGSMSETLAAILKEDPDWSRLPKQLPHRIQDLIEHCLRKDPHSRIQAIGDVRLTIEEYLADPEKHVAAAISVPGGKTNRYKLILVGGLLGLVLGVLLTWTLEQISAIPSPTPVWLEANLANGQSLSTTQGNSVALSPDGKQLALVVADKGLYLRSLDRLEGDLLQGTEGAYAPFLSPDGQWLGFFAGEASQTELKKVSTSGGTPLILCRVSGLGRGATWGPEGTIMFAQSIGNMMEVSANGGTPTDLIKMEEGELSQSWPQLLPTGHHVLFTSATSAGSRRIEVLEVETGQRKVIREGGRYPRYSVSGHLLFVDSGTLFAAPFDLQGFQLTTGPVPVLQDVRLDFSLWGAAHYDVSPNGTLVYLKRNEGGFLVEWMDPEGRREPLLDAPNDYRHIRFSPDGRRLALEIYDGAQNDIWMYEWERDTLSRLTLNANHDGVPVWSPDSTGVVFHSDRDGHGIYWRRSDGSGDAVRLTQSRIRQAPYSWHPSGKHLAFYQSRLETSLDIGILSLESDVQSGWKAGEPTDFLKTPFNEWSPTFSPDGEWLAYTSDESGQPEIYVRPFPGPGGKSKISNDGGVVPAWFSNGRDLSYQRGDQIMLVSYTVVGESFRAGKSRLWTEEELSLRQNVRNYDPDPDGERIAVFRAAHDQAEERTDNPVLILNFFEVLGKELATEN